MNLPTKDDCPPPAPASLIQGFKANTPAHLLLIHDQESTRAALLSALTKHGFDKVTCVSSGADALRSLASDKPDLAIIDANLRGTIDATLITQLLNNQHGIPSIHFTADEGALCSSDPTSPGIEARLLLLSIEFALYRSRTESQLHLQARALDLTDNEIIITDGTGATLWANGAFYRNSGYTPSETLGKKPGELVGSGLQDQGFYQELWRQISSGKTWQGEMINRTQSGHRNTQSVTITPITTPLGVITHYIGINRDVTLQKSLENDVLKSQRMEALGQLSAGMAHDFNNTLEAVLLHVGWLRGENQLTPASNVALDQLEKAVQRGACMSRQLLDFAKQTPGDFTCLNASELACNLQPILKRLLGETIRLETRFPEAPLWIQADYARLEQALLNLAINARDAMPKGGTLSIEGQVVRKSPPGAPEATANDDFVEIRITDTGCGMTKEVCARIFDPYFTTKGPLKGTGLGLPLVDRTLRQLKGWVSVTSSPGKGSSFSLFIPLCSPGSPSLHSIEQPAHNGNGEHILILEDESVLRQAMAVLLRKNQYEVFDFVSTRDAHAYLAQTARLPDLCIIDQVLSNEECGLQFARQIQQRHPGLPMLLCSGYATPNTAPHGIPEGTLYLAKPFTAHELLEAANLLLRKPQQPRSSGDTCPI